MRKLLALLAVLVTVAVFMAAYWGSGSGTDTYWGSQAPASQPSPDGWTWGDD